MSPANVTCARLQPSLSPPWQCHPVTRVTRGFVSLAVPPSPGTGISLHGSAILTRDRDFSPGQGKASANIHLPACLTASWEEGLPLCCVCFPPFTSEPTSCSFLVLCHTRFKLHLRNGQVRKVGASLRWMNLGSFFLKGKRCFFQ